MLSRAKAGSVLVRTARRGAALALALACAFGAAGCARVAPWQRGKLAHPTMTSRSFDSLGAQHLRAVSEGARGGGSGRSAGCGCN